MRLDRRRALSATTAATCGFAAALLLVYLAGVGQQMQQMRGIEMRMMLFPSQHPAWVPLDQGVASLEDLSRTDASVTKIQQGLRRLQQSIGGSLSIVDEDDSGLEFDSPDDDGPRVAAGRADGAGSAPADSSDRSDNSASSTFRSWVREAGLSFLVLGHAAATAMSYLTDDLAASVCAACLNVPLLLVAHRIKRLDDAMESAVGLLRSAYADLLERPLLWLDAEGRAQAQVAEMVAFSAVLNRIDAVLAYWEEQSIGVRLVVPGMGAVNVTLTTLLSLAVVTLPTLLRRAMRLKSGAEAARRLVSAALRQQQWIAPARQRNARLLGRRATTGLAPTPAGNAGSTAVPQPNVAPATAGAIQQSAANSVQSASTSQQQPVASNHTASNHTVTSPQLLSVANAVVAKWQSTAKEGLRRRAFARPRDVTIIMGGATSSDEEDEDWEEEVREGGVRNRGER